MNKKEDWVDRYLDRLPPLYTIPALIGILSILLGLLYPKIIPCEIVISIPILLTFGIAIHALARRV